MLKEKNDVITLKSDIEMKYNVVNINNAQNDLQGKIAESTKVNTNLKADLKKKMIEKTFCVVFFVGFFLL